MEIAGARPSARALGDSAGDYLLASAALLEEITSEV
jgi:hypothetical protein